MSSDGYRTGPVAIVGGRGHVGRAVGRRLEEFRNEVIPLGRQDDWRTLLDAESVIHLAGTLQPIRPNTYEAANVGTVERVLAAVDPDRIQRLIFLSYVGADPLSKNEYLRTKGRAEQLLMKSGIPTVVIRSTFVYGDRTDIGPSFTSYMAGPGGRVSVLGDCSQRIAPVHADDLARLLVGAALDPAKPTGIFEVAGRETLTLDQFVEELNSDDVRIRHLHPTLAKILSRLLPSLTPALVEVLLGDSVASADPAEVENLFEVRLRSPRQASRIGAGRQ